MSFLNKLFGSPDASETENPEEKKERDFSILKDDGVRAKNMGEYPYAEKCLKQALQLKDEAETKSYLVEVLLRQHKQMKALPLLKELTATEPDNIELTLLLAQAASDIEDWETMAAACEQAKAIDPEDARTMYLEAVLAKGKADVFTAIAKTTQAIAKEDKYLKAYELRAQLLLDMGQAGEAGKDIDKLIELDPENDEYYIRRGNAEQLLGNEANAEQAFKKSLELNPFSRKSQLALISLYENFGHMDKALKMANELINEEDDVAEAYKLRGEIRFKLHDKEGAADDLERYLKLKPEEEKNLDGEFTNAENQFEEKYYRASNPFMGVK